MVETTYTNSKELYGETGTLDKLVARDLEEFTDDKIATVGTYALYNNNGLKKICLPTARRLYDYSFASCSNLVTADLGWTRSVSINSSAFNNDYNLKELIIRSSSLSSLNGSISTTKIGRGQGGIYVPSVLLDTYKRASNWSAYANHIYPLEDYPKEQYCSITDTWDEIITAEQDGTYLTKYQVGDTKTFLYNGNEVYARIIGINADDLPDGTKAKITWLCDTSTGSGIMNPISTTTRIGFSKDTSIGENCYISDNQGKQSSDAYGLWNITMVEDGILAIKYKVSSESGFDKLTIKLDDETIVNAISGEVDWTTYSFDCVAGQHITVSATYHKDGFVDKGTDTGYINFESDVDFTIENNSAMIYESAMGTIGGWESSQMRNYLLVSIYPNIEESLQEKIVAVKKVQTAYNSEGEAFTQETEDKIWIPAYSEIIGDEAIYQYLNYSTGRRIRYNIYFNSVNYWLRDACTINNFYCCDNYGRSSNYASKNSFAIVFGFCT